MDASFRLAGDVVVVGDEHHRVPLLVELHDQGNTVVLITHDNDIARQAPRSVHILDGRLTEVTL